MSTSIRTAKTKALALLGLALLLAAPLRAAPREGDLDPSFGAGQTYGPGHIALTSIAGTAIAVAIQNDGKIVIAGHKDGAHATLFVARLYQDGTLDTAFGGAGSGVFTYPAATDTSANALAIASDGGIVVAGTYGNQGLVLHLRTDGTVDPSSTRAVFGVDGDSAHNTVIHDVKLNPYDAVYVVGTYDGSGHQQIMLGLLGPDGSVLAAKAGDVVNESLDQFAGALALQADGKIVVSGYVLSSYLPGDGRRPYYCLVARYGVTLDGSGWNFPPDDTFAVHGRTGLYNGVVSPGPYTYADCFNDLLSLRGDGSILVAGRSFDPNDSAWKAIYYQVDGSGQHISPNIIPNFAITPFGDNSIRRALIQRDGKVVFTGTSGWNDGQGDTGSGWFAIRATADLQSLDASFGNGTGAPGVTYFELDNRDQSSDQSFASALDRYGRAVLVGNTAMGVASPDGTVVGVARLQSDLIFENSFELHE